MQKVWHYTFWSITSLAMLALAMFVMYHLYKNRRQIWTIAAHSILQAVRMRMVIVLVAFLLVLVPALPFLLQSDNTHVGQLRIVMTYSIYLITFLLSILTLFLSTMTLNTEIKNQNIFLLDPKPVPRWVVLTGKWFGVMAINFVLLAAMLGSTFGLVRWLANPWPATWVRQIATSRFLGSTDQARHILGWMNESPQERMMIRAELLTARKVSVPPEPDLTERINEEVTRLKEQRLMPVDKSEAWVRRQLYERYSKSAWYVPPGSTLTWNVPNVPKDAEFLVIRFRHYGDKGTSQELIPGLFIINEQGQPESRISNDFTVNSPHSFGIPASVVKADGSVDIRYVNMGQDSTVPAALFPFQEGIQVMYPAGSMAGNFLRAGLMIFIRLSFVAIVGIFASTFLSFPVAVLLTIVIFVIGHGVSFIMGELLPDLYVFGSSMVPPGTPGNPIDDFIKNALAVFFSMFPNFGSYDVVPALTDGRLILRGWMWSAFFWLILIRGGVLAVAGIIIFRRRELARLTAST